MQTLPSIQGHVCIVSIIKSFGFIDNADGVHPDLEMVTTIHKKHIQEVTQLQYLGGLLIYLASSITKCSMHTAHCTSCCIKDGDLIWNETCTVTFTKKNLFCKETALHYFDTSKSVILLVNTSKQGFAAALLWKGKPVAFTVNALTPIKRHSFNTKHKSLACTLGVECFYTNVFGCKLTLESGQNLCEQIQHKNLADPSIYL